MSDYLSGFDDWSAAFTDWTDISISELHGILTALVCAIKPPTADEWVQLLGELSLTVPSEKAVALLVEYGEDVAFALKDKDEAYEYTPLLPDDEHDLYERLLALKDWAGGFITGIGVADIHLTADEKEMLADLSKIASLRPSEDEEHDESEGEEMYLHLFEFARMVPVALAVRQKKSVKTLALIKGLASDRQTAQEQQRQAKKDTLPPVIDVMGKH